MKVHVLLVDDHALFRAALRRLLEQDARFEVVAEAGNGLEALAKAGEVRPDVICMDMNMPVMNGLEATREILAAQPLTRVIALSAHTDRVYVQGMLEAGAIGYVTKDEADRELLWALHAAAQDQTYLCGKVATEVADSLALAANSQSPLERCEIDILQRVADEMARSSPIEA